MRKHLDTCATNEDSNQHAHPRSLIKVFNVHTKNLLFLSIKMRPGKILISLINLIFVRRTCPWEGGGGVGWIRFLTLRLI